MSLALGFVPSGRCLGTFGSSLCSCKIPTQIICPRGLATSGRQRPRLVVQARDRQRRLLSYVLSAPQRIERYMESSIWRRWMWAGISLFTGYYAGNIVSLSFGALAVNDVFAGVVTVLFYEVVTHLYYTSDKPSLRLWFANCFKMGVTASLLADAAKLGS